MAEGHTHTDLYYSLGNAAAAWNDFLELLPLFEFFASTGRDTVPLNKAPFKYVLSERREESSLIQQGFQIPFPDYYCGFIQLCRLQIKS